MIFLQNVPNHMAIRMPLNVHQCEQYSHLKHEFELEEQEERAPKITFYGVSRMQYEIHSKNEEYSEVTYHTQRVTLYTESR